MAHAQQQVLDRIQTLLIAGATAAGNRVYVDRVDAIPADQLPAIRVDEAEAGDTREVHFMGGQHQCTLAVEIRCLLAEAGATANEARAFGAAIEVLINNDQALRDMCTLQLFMESSAPLITGDGDRLIAGRLQSWRFSYVVDPTAPETILT